MTSEYLRWRVLGVLLLSWIWIVSAAWAEPRPNGPVFDLAPVGSGVSVVTNARGRTLYVWSEEGLVKGRIDNSAGQPVGDTLTFAGEERFFASWPAASMAEDGSFVVVWNQQPVVPILPPAPVLMAQRFDAQGDPLGDPFESLDGRGSHRPPVVAMHADGSFLVVAAGGDIDGRGVFLKRFDHRSDPLPGLTRVSPRDPNFGFLQGISIALAPTRQALISWTTYVCATDSCLNFRIHGQRLSANGRLQGDSFLITDQGAASNLIWHPSLGFLAVWQKPVPNDFLFANAVQFSVLARRVGPGGVGPLVDVKEEATGQLELGQTAPAVAVDSRGRVLVAWEDGIDFQSSSEIFAQELDSQLVAEGTRRKLERWEGSSNRSPTAAGAGSRGILLAWTEEMDSDVLMVPRAQRFELTGSTCIASETTLCLQDGRFAVTGTYRIPPGDGGSGDGGSGDIELARFDSLSEDSGVVWFFRPENLEGLIKILDGRAVNGHFWVFLAGLSNLETEFLVQDLETGQSQTYRNPPGHFSSFGDTEAFLAPGSSSGSFLDSGSFLETGLVRDPASIPLSAMVGGLGPLPAAGQESSCEPSPVRLCLLGGRFAVEVERAPDSSGGDGTPAEGRPLTERTGVFWFGSSDNLELLVRLHDGRAANGKFWIFWGAATNQGYGLTVTDTESNEVWSHENAAGSFGSGADTDAF